VSRFFLDDEGLPHLLLVGLTGGIGTGKSTVAGMLREAGCPVVDADAIVHRLLDPGGAAGAAVLEAFGGVAEAGGGVDRAALADIVFKDEAQRKRLEAIVHPLVVAESRDRMIAAARETGTEMVVYDAALLIETERYRQFHRLVVVYTRPSIQLQRIMERDKTGPDKAGARIRSQMPIERKAALADYLVDNSGHWQETRKQVSTLIDQLAEDARLLRQGLPLPIRRVSPFLP
jgi:dephospho-CoA kinase